MRKQYQLQNLDCAHCAMKIEEEIKKIPGVSFASINFVAQKMTLEAEDALFPSIYKKAVKKAKEIEPEILISQNKYEMTGVQRKEAFVIILSTLLFVLSKIGEEFLAPQPLLSLLLFLPAYLLSGFVVIRKALIGITNGRIFDENFLMMIATFGAFAIGEAGEGVMVMLLYRIGEFFQELAVSKSRRNITELMNIRPDFATLLDGEEEIRVDPEEVNVGSLIIIKPGEKIPLDGVVEEGTSFIDTTALTGESVPREVQAGDGVFSGTVNMNGVLRIRTTKAFAESSVSKILDLVENASEGKSRAERFISRFARYYTPAVVILALSLVIVPPLLGGDFFLWVHKAITCLVISCPCALVISVPLTFFGGIGCAGKNGILIKGADSLESLSKAGGIAFDKTGTLTKGNFEVTAIHPETLTEEELLELAATCEHYSDHPISLSLKAAFNRDIDKSRIGKITEKAGKGVSAMVDGVEYLVGNELLLEEEGISIMPCDKCCHKGTVVHVGSKGEYLGHIVVSDTLKKDSRKAVENLKKLGLDPIALLSGDEEGIALEVAQMLGIKKVYGGLLPQEKYEKVTNFSTSTEKPFLFVGDGINDAPVLSGADIGIAMGGIGADAAVEAADVVICDDKPSKVALAIRIARKTMGIVWQNIILSVGIKLFVLIPNIFLGEESVPLWLAIFADVGVCLIAILNATRTLTIRKEKEK